MSLTNEKPKNVNEIITGIQRLQRESPIKKYGITTLTHKDQSRSLYTKLSPLFTGNNDVILIALTRPKEKL